MAHERPLEEGVGRRWRDCRVSYWFTGAKCEPSDQGPLDLEFESFCKCTCLQFLPGMVRPVKINPGPQLCPALLCRGGKSTSALGCGGSHCPWLMWMGLGGHNCGLPLPCCRSCPLASSRRGQPAYVGVVERYYYWAVVVIAITSTTAVSYTAGKDVAGSETTIEYPESSPWISGGKRKDANGP